MQFKDYYKIMGVKPDASADEIKKAYRVLARKHHPDRNPGATHKESEEKFKDVGEAYEVLKDPQKRAAYDQLYRGGYQAGQEFNVPPGWEFHTQRPGGGGARARAASAEEMHAFSDFFESLFGGGEFGGFGGFGRGGFEGFQTGRQSRSFKAPGEDLFYAITISLEEAYTGTTRSLNLQLPNQATKTLQVKIPAGVVEGQQIRLRGQGGSGMGGAPNGDLYLEIHISPHHFFHLHKKDVNLVLPVAPWEAALGASINVPTLGGKIALKIPANSQAGKKLRLKGRGLPGSPPGDQYVILQIALPPADTEQQKNSYREMEKAIPFNPRSHLRY